MINGFLTGMTGSSAVPGVFFLQSIGLLRDQLIQSMRILFALSATSLAWSLRTQDLLEVNLLLMSAAAPVPAFLGMSLGNNIRHNIPEENSTRYSVPLWCCWASASRSRILPHDTGPVH
ncbi:hypothetical protein ACIO3O_39330 [Streptomyces sp. NPDC087440]|uniref:hypothetical protein n=1 Tax=Streptomyces sp. NPDC087440 TaxID=3365790 RepID=UPI00381531F2